MRFIPFIWHPLVPSVTNGLATVRVRKTGLILNMPEIRSVSSSYVLYGRGLKKGLLLTQLLIKTPFTDFAFKIKIAELVTKPVLSNE